MTGRTEKAQAYALSSSKRSSGAPTCIKLRLSQTAWLPWRGIGARRPDCAMEWPGRTFGGEGRSSAEQAKARASMRAIYAAGITSGLLFTTTALIGVPVPCVPEKSASSFR